jgi:hypothetical protein
MYHLTANQYTSLPATGTPSSGDAGIVGQIRVDSNRLYIWTGANTVKYVNLTTL